MAVNKEALKKLIKLSEAIRDAYDYEPELLEDWGISELWERLDRFISRNNDDDGTDDDDDSDDPWLNTY